MKYVGMNKSHRGNVLKGKGTVSAVVELVVTNTITNITVPAAVDI